MTNVVQSGPIIEQSPDMALTTIDTTRTARGMVIASDRPADRAAELLRFAIEKGMPVESLQQLLEMEERVSQRQAAQDFAIAMAAFQAECRSIKRGSTAKIATKSGGSFSYTYADLDEIARAVNPILAKHGLSYTFDSKLEKDYLTCICTVRHINGHSVPSSFTLPTSNESAMSAQQKVGAALTFAKRQSLSAALGITTTDDDPDVAELDPTPINEDQATVLADLVKETGANVQRFLKFMDAKSIAEIRAVDYPRALGALQRKKEKV